MDLIERKGVYWYGETLFNQTLFFMKGGEHTATTVEINQDIYLWAIKEPPKDHRAV